jgi:hypothetical protein
MTRTFITSTVKRLFAASALSLLTLSGGAFAQTAPAAPTAPTATEAPAAVPGGASAVSSPEDCLKAAFDIAQTAEDKKLADDQLSKIEDLLTKMESHCDAKQFTEAASVGSDLKALIQKQ